MIEHEKRPSVRSATERRLLLLLALVLGVLLWWSVLRAVGANGVGIGVGVNDAAMQSRGICEDTWLLLLELGGADLIDDGRTAHAVVAMHGSGVRVTKCRCAGKLVLW